MASDGLPAVRFSIWPTYSDHGTRSFRSSATARRPGGTACTSPTTSCRTLPTVPGDGRRTSAGRPWPGWRRRTAAAPRHLVSGNTYRHPAVLAKMATPSTTSAAAGRARHRRRVAGERAPRLRHPVPDVKERLDRLDEACQVITRPAAPATARRSPAATTSSRTRPLDPKPVQRRLPSARRRRREAHDAHRRRACRRVERVVRSRDHGPQADGARPPLRRRRSRCRRDQRVDPGVDRPGRHAAAAAGPVHHRRLCGRVVERLGQFATSAWASSSFPVQPGRRSPSAWRTPTDPWRRSPATYLAVTDAGGGRRGPGSRRRSRRDPRSRRRHRAPCRRLGCAPPASSTATGASSTAPAGGDR